MMLDRKFKSNTVALITTLLLTVMLVGAVGTASVAAQEAPTVQNDEIAVDGSEIVINTGGEATAVAVTELPSESEILDNGDFNPTRDGLLATNFAGLPDTVSFTLRPPQDSENITLNVGGNVVELPVADNTATPVVKTTEITPSGSEIVINTSGVGSVSVTGLPEGGDVIDRGDFARTDPGELLATDLGTGLSNEISFTFKPPEGTENQVISFSVAGQQTSVEVVPVPTEVSETVNKRQYNAVYEDNSRPDTQQMSTKINDWFKDQKIGDTSLGTREMSRMINFWFNDS